MLTYIKEHPEDCLHSTDIEKKTGIHYWKVQAYFGGMRKYYKDHGLEYSDPRKIKKPKKKRHIITKEEISEDILRVYEEYNTTRKVDYIKYGKYSATPVDRIFGGWNKMLIELNLPINMPKHTDQITKEEIAEEMARVYKKYGYINVNIQRKHSKYSQHVIDQHFGSFNNMLKELGYDINVYRGLSDDDLLYELKLIYYKYGTLSGKILDDNCSVTRETVYNRFGTLMNVFHLLHIDGEPLDYNQSGGSIIVKRYLEDHCIKFEEEKRFEWLVNENSEARYRLDFYLPEYKWTIEYDGSQHYQPTTIFGGLNGLYENQKRDTIKNQLCFEHGIGIFRIRYDEDTEERLNYFFTNIVMHDINEKPVMV